MGADRIRYLIRMRGSWRYKPSEEMREAGFGFKTLSTGIEIGGVNYATAEDKAYAIERNDEWDRLRRSGEAVVAPRYPEGSIGAAWERVMALRMAERVKTGKKYTYEEASRDDWPRAWRWIEPFFADQPMTAATPEHFLSLDPDTGKPIGLIPYVEHHGSDTERHRAVKVWRAFWAKAAPGDLKDPSKAFANPAPKPRQAVWTEGEVVRLVKRAIRMSYHGLAALMATAWDSQLSPVDARKLTPGQRVDDEAGAVFALARAKTGRGALASLGRRATRILDTYIASLAFTLMPATPIFHTRGAAPGPKGGRPRAPVPYQKGSLVSDFADVREAEFGKAETRKLSDMRRSGTFEAEAGGATDKEIEKKMANTYASNSRLRETYGPANLAVVRSADEKRRTGRARLREQTEPKSVTAPARRL